ncbi:Chaperone SurA [Candidatus Nitrosacidococcus sp. I8]|nr:Chaperone SurA [Candidatus Nitrosacidococcus sp. I8]
MVANFMRVVFILFSLFWIIHSYGAGNLFLDRIVAVVNDEAILESELEQTSQNIEAQLEAKGGPMPPTDILEKQVLERLVMQHLQLQLAERVGIRVSDDMLNEALKNIAQHNNLTLSEFRDKLKESSIPFSAFRENVREEITISQLHKREIEDRITISDAELDNFIATQKKQGNQDAQYHIAHILVAIPEASSPEEIQKAKKQAQQIIEKLRSGADFQKVAMSYSDGHQALEGGDLGWRKLSQLPTLFVDEIPKLKVGELSNPIRSPSGFHIVKLLEVKGDDVGEKLVPQVHARHILIRTDELKGDEEIELRLSELRQRALLGEKFTELARAHSEDKGSAIKGGDLGWVSPGEMVPQFEQVIYSLNPDEISEPFKTQFGWHIAQVVAKREKNMTDSYSRNKAKQELHARKAEENLEDWMRQLRDEAYVEYRLDSFNGEI